MSNLVKYWAPLSSYLNSSKVSMACRVLCIAVLTMVMSIFILICVRSALGVNTRFDNQSVGPSACSMTPDSSNSSKILLSFFLFVNGILR